jgi:kynurenine formamidase
MTSQVAPHPPATWNFELHDLTRPIAEETAFALLGDLCAGEEWANFRRVEIVYDREWPRDTGTQGHFTVSDHAATHIDAPVHGVEGAAYLEDVDISRLIGEAVVIDLRRDNTDHGYTASDFDGATPEIRPGDIVLICSGFREVTAEQRIHQTFLTVEGAQWLVDRGVHAVGCEPAGIEHVPDGLLVHHWYDKNTPHQPPWPAHDVLLRSNVYIIEGLTNLEPIKGQRVHFAALPLLIPGLTGCPVRAVAWIDR